MEAAPGQAVETGGDVGLDGVHGYPLPRRRKSSFLKKRSKKLLSVTAGITPPGGPNASRNGQKFFGSFFQKRTFFFSLNAFLLSPFRALFDAWRVVACMTRSATQPSADTEPDLPPPSWRVVSDLLREGVGLGEVIRDAAHRIVDWRYLEVNAAWEKLTGIPRQRALGGTARALAPHGQPEWLPDIAAVVNTGTPATFARKINAFDRWYEGRAVRLEPERFAILFLEVTAHHDAEDQASRLVGLVEQSADFIAIADPDGRVRFVNPAGLRLVGLADLAAARRTQVADYIAPEDHDLLATGVLPRLQQDGLWEGELRFRDFRDGAIFPVQYSIFPLRNRQGVVTGYGTVTRDIGEVRKSEQRRAALLELGDRLRDLTDAVEMARVAAEIMVRTLGASRAAYGTIDAAHAAIDIGQEWTAPGVAGIAGTYRFADYGTFMADLSRGETVVVTDTEQDPRTAPSAALWRAVGARALINHPIFERGDFVALFLIQQTEPRDWCPHDVAFVRNVADRTRAAVERQHAEDRLRALAASLEREVAARTADRNRVWQLSEDIMVVMRLDGVVTAVNPAWQAVLGWCERDLLGRRLDDLVHPDDVARSVSAAAGLIAGAAPRRFHHRLRHRAGGYRWIAWTAVAGEGAINAMGRDVTHERAQTAALELSEARLRSVFETTYQFLGLLTPDGIVLDANPVSLEAVGVTLDDVRGVPFWRTPWFTGTEGLPEQVEAAVARVAAGETFRQEVPVDLPRGKCVFDFAMRPVFNGAGRVIAIVPGAIDLTERRAAEAQLRQAQKMEAVGQLTGGIAHDFNNLLTGISGGLAAVRARLAQGRVQDVERYLAGVEASASRAAALTQRLLAFSRQQTLDPTTLQVNAVVAGMADLIRGTVGPQVVVHCVLAEDLWLTRCDGPQLESALLNLSINARDAMPDGGRLTLETANTLFDAAEASARDMASGAYVTISVTDTGVGMKPDVVARAFDPFFTTKPLGQGTGLGLSMVYGFAKQSGGQVRIHSAEDVGTTIRLHLPRDTQGTATEPASTPSDPVPARSGGGTILVVEDEPFVAMLITDVLSELGYTIIDAHNAAGGLAALRSDQPIDLLITDVGLPGGMNGKQLADEARVLQPGLKVLFVTGYAAHGVLDGGPLPAGMQVLSKPFAEPALIAKVELMLRH